MRMKQIPFVILLLSITFISSIGQRKGLETINTHDLKMHMEFLASDALEGRNTGEQGLVVAARYLGVHANQLGLDPADSGDGFFQYYTIQEKLINRENSHITIGRVGQSDKVNRDLFFMLSSTGEDHLILEGEVVFAGYGINDEEQNYNDLENVDGSEFLFGAEKYTGMRSMQYKMQGIFEQHPKAVLIVQDPRSGYTSIEVDNPMSAW